STFEQMALRYSEDPNAATDQGHLGSFQEDGFQIPEFADAVKDLKEGEISQPFKTNFGYHIVKLNEREDARTLSLKDDWEQIEQWALQKKRENEFQDWLAELREQIPVIVKIDI
ncbi:MAG: peptidylprolyl isomerase, partial [Calditrichia bacterium]